MQKCKNSRLQKYKIRQGEIQVATTSAPVLLHLPHFLCAAPKPIYFYGPPASNLKKTSVLWCKENLCPHRDPKCCLTPFKEIQSNSGRNLICPGIFFLAIPPIFGSTKRVPYIFLNKCTSYIEKCGISLCHLITKCADDQNVIQHTHLLHFLPL